MMIWNNERIDRLKSYLDSLKPNWGGRLLFYIFPIRKKMVIKNMRHVFGRVLNDDEIYKLALCFYSHIATSLKEIFVMTFMSKKQIKRKAEVQGEKYIVEYLNREAQGVLILTGHFGNWEFAPVAGMLNFQQYKGGIYVVRKNPANRYSLINHLMEKIVFRRFYQSGLEIIRKENAIIRVSDVLALKQGVVFVMDQYAQTSNKDGIAVDFFDSITGTYQSLALIACYSKAPVFPARSYRRHSDGKHVIEFFPPLSWEKGKNKRDEIYLNTRKYNEVLEQFVIDFPEQWNWMHRRWRNI